MSAEIPGTTQARPALAAWLPWLRLAGVAILLLAVSEALWLWQTWPVRELLQPAPVATPGAR